VSAAQNLVFTSELVQNLGAVLGAGPARERVLSALRALGLDEGRITFEQATTVLAQLERLGGAAGAAARLAQRKLAGGALAGGTATPLPRAARGSGEVGREELAALLAPSVGEELAAAAIDRAATRIGMGTKGTLETALAVLDAVAAEPGIVGTTARFAKARLHLK
jgi:hypothetical protein